MNILITGASKGIGNELVKCFAQHKNNLIIALGRNLDELTVLKQHCEEKYQTEIFIYSVDFAKEEFKTQLENIFQKHNFHFDIIINNAGYLVNLPFKKMALNEIRQTYQVNVYAPIVLLQTVFNCLDTKKICHVINIGSMGGFQGSAKFAGLSVYSSSKAALANLTECLAEEYKNKNVYVNCLALGSVKTEMLKKAFPDFKAQTTANKMAMFIYNFSIQQPILMNGKIIPISVTTP